ncbi:MAG: MerR family transcriptional regulator [Spirochaetaceae bacterium]|nr:MAG: MerR family transcriptional regulator [Spirochaetaceae bacterium]
MTYTIVNLGDLFRLSRSTLLYYDRLGLLAASHRSSSAYRVYTEDDRERLKIIVRLRGIGIPLKKIRQFLQTPEEGILRILLNRLLNLNSELDCLQNQQALLLQMIESEGTLAGSKPFLARMGELGRQAGIHEGNYEKVHRVFEKTSSKAHRKFLKFLGFSDSETRDFIKQISNKD